MQQLQIIIDWSKLSKEKYMYLMQKSNIDSNECINEFKKIISNEIYNQDAFFKGLDFSYSYEDQFEFTCKELLNYT